MPPIFSYRGLGGEFEGRAGDPYENVPRPSPQVLLFPHHQHRRPLDLAPAQPVEGLVGRLQGKGLHRGFDRHPGGELKKLLAVGPGQVGHRADHPLPPEQVVGKRRDVAHVDAAADHDPAFGRGPQGRGDERRPPAQK